MNARTLAARLAQSALIATCAIGMYGIGYQQGHTVGTTEGQSDGRRMSGLTRDAVNAQTYCPGCTVRVTTWHHDAKGTVDTWETFPDGYRQRTYVWTNADLAGSTTVNQAAK